MLNTRRAGPTFGKAQLKMVTHAEIKKVEDKSKLASSQPPDKEDIVALCSFVENLLKSRSLFWTKAATYAIFIGSTTGSHLAIGIFVAQCCWYSIFKFKCGLIEDTDEEHT